MTNANDIKKKGIERRKAKRRPNNARKNAISEATCGRISPDASGLFFLTGCFLSFFKSTKSLKIYEADERAQKIRNPTIVVTR